MAPVRVAHIVGKWLGGGVESVVMNYYRHINHCCIQFDFICDEDSDKIPYDEISHLGGRVLKVPPYQQLWAYQRALRKIFNENKYTIVHSHINTLSVFPLMVAKCAGIPIRIAHSHSTTSRKEWKRNVMKQLLRPFSKLFATDFMCCSEYAGRWLFGDNEYENGHVYLLNNAIDLDKLKYDEGLRESKRKELGIKDGTLVVGHVGRFVEQKNHKFLVDVFNAIHQRKPESVLLLVGKGPLIEEVEERIANLGLCSSVEFLGQRNDVAELYQAFDAFVLPSLYEGLPVVGVEAQAAGLLCMLSDAMTKETKVLDSTIFMSLKDSSIEWGETLLEKYESFERMDTREKMANKNFTIKTEVKKLENKYLELIKAAHE